MDQQVYISKLLDSATPNNNAETDSPSKKTLPSGTLISFINESSKKAKLRVNRLQPQGDDGAIIWIEQANFNSLVLFSDILTKEGAVKIETINITRNKNGQKNLVSATVEIVSH